MTKPSLGKTLLTTSLAAALLVGGGAALLRTTAFAEDASGTSVTTSTYGTQDGSGGKIFKDRGMRDGGRFAGGNVMKEAAALLGLDEKTLADELRGGKTLAQIAQEKSSLSEDALIQKLSDAITAKLDEQVKSGKLTQDQADRMKSGLADRLKQTVEGKGFAGHGPGMGGPGAPGGPGGPGGPRGFGGPVDTKDLADFLKLSEDDLRSKLQSGQSLSAVAQEQGISEDQLIAHIKDGMTDKIKAFVERSHKAPDMPKDPQTQTQSQAPAAQ